MSASRFYYDAMSARQEAHHLSRTRPIGWKIYFRMSMARARRKWRQYADAVRLDNRRNAA